MPKLSNKEFLSVLKDFFWKARLLPLLGACLYSGGFDKAKQQGSMDL
jgi:hypothetical protein